MVTGYQTTGKRGREAMKEKMKQIKMDTILTAVLYIVLGVVLFIWSDKAILLLGRVIAIVLIVVGLINLTHYIRERQQRYAYSSTLGIISLLVGIWMFVQPQSAAKLIPIVLGVVMIIDGIEDIRLSAEAKTNMGSRWGASVGMGIVSIVFGVVCILNAFGVVNLVFKGIGLMLIYNGITDLIIVYKTVQAVKTYEQERSAVDSEFREV